MKIIIISEWYSEKMGYAENYLPKSLGKLGNEVHLITSDLQVYGTSKNYKDVYEKHLGPNQVKIGVSKKEHFTLHRCPHKLKKGIEIIGLEEKISTIKPDLIYCFEITDPNTFTVAKLKNKYSYKIFCESRMHQSIFQKPHSVIAKIKQLKHIFNGKVLSKKVNLFYPIANDVLNVICKYFGISKTKCKTASLAVETDLFFPLSDDTTAQSFRKKMNYDLNDIVCLYTGRFTPEKDPLILAKAIHHLNSNGYTEFKALFVGNGETNYQNLIEKCLNCKVVPFVQSNELPIFYQSFDIGVWPLQESTSQLDAIASGMPIIVNNTVEDTFRIEGNGLQYKKNDYIDLAEKILSLKNKNTREKMGKHGASKIKNLYSWDYLAKQKELDYHLILNQK